MQFLITDELDKRDRSRMLDWNHPKWREGRKTVFCRANGAYRHNLEHLREALVSDWTNIFVRVNGSTENIQCHLWLPIISFAGFYYVQLFVTSNIFVFTKSTWNESLEVFPAARGAPGCSRSWESDFCQLQTLQMRICKIWESGSAATPLFMLVPFK